MKLIIATLVVVGLLCHSAVEGNDDLSDSLIELDLRSTENGKLFYVEVEIGEGHSRQPFNLLISTWLHDITWVP